MKLKQQIFAHEYLVDFNATRAAIAAGYSKKSANSYGIQLLLNPQVSEYLRSIAAERLRKIDISAEHAIAAAWEILNGDLFDLIDINSKGEASLRKDPNAKGLGVKEVSYATGKNRRSLRIVMQNKDVALTLLFKYFGLIGGDKQRVVQEVSQDDHARVRKAFERIIARREKQSLDQVGHGPTTSI